MPNTTHSLYGKQINGGARETKERTYPKRYPVNNLIFFMRPSTRGAATLIRSNEPSEWAEALAHYDEAIEAVSRQKSLQSKLAEYDNWIRVDFPVVLDKREEPFMTRSELERVMQWKLWRGKDRPMLMSLVKQNSENTVQQVSSASFKLAKKLEWIDAVKKLTELRGVGPATASAVLSVVYPEGVVFMADEVIEAATSRKREYTMKTYCETIEFLLDKQRKLGGAWTPGKMGSALWSAGVIAQGEDIDNFNSKKTGRGVKRKR